MPKKFRQSSLLRNCLIVLFALHFACIRIVPGVPYALEFLRIQFGDLGVIDDDHVFIVLLISVIGEVERAGDDDMIVDDDHLVMQKGRVAILAYGSFCAE